MKLLILIISSFLVGCVNTTDTTDTMMKHNKLHCNNEGFQTYYDLDNRIVFTCTGGQDFYIKE